VAATAPIRSQRFRREDGACCAHASALLTPAQVLDRIRTVARALEAEPGLTSRELAERARLSRRHMSLLLLRLEEHGHVVREGRRWFLGAETVA
jgi:DNA-binding MarR family transcriptional regulator